MTAETANDSRPVKPRWLRTIVDETDDHVQLHIPSSHPFAVAFLILWQIGWSVGCVFLLREVIVKQQLFMLLFATPFLAAWVFVAVLIASMLFARVRLVLTKEGLAYEHRLFAPTSRRFMPLAEIFEFQDVLNTPGDSDSGPTYHLAALGLGRRISFGGDLPKREREWLGHRLNEALARFRRQSGVEAPSRELSAAPGPTDDVLPIDSRWQRLDDGDRDSITFQQTGRTDWTALGGLTFIALFWNGIVGVFVCGLAGLTPDGKPGDFGDFGWWGMFFFLIPFEAIGLGIFAAWTLAVTERWKVVTWRFACDAVDVEAVRLGWRSHELYSTDRIGAIDVTDEPPSGKWKFQPTRKPAETNDERFGLLIVDRGAEEVATLSGLTLGEARWMHRQLLTEHADWFA